ncbi:MAG: RsmE family RNA methyltransferase [Acidobacteriota bacterium]
MPPRFFAPALDAAAAEIDLPPDEAAHLTRVLRLGPGARVRVFDGRGGEWDAEVLRADKRGATLGRLRAASPAPELSRPVTLALAVLKGDGFDAAVRDATMLGASRLVPLVTARSEVPLAALARPARAARWQRIAVASAKQCGRAVVPTIDPACAVDAFCGLPARGARIALVEPAAVPEACALRQVKAPDGLELLIGPEGGWAAGELARFAETGVTLVQLGRRTLRADAMPVIALSAWLATSGEW